MDRHDRRTVSCWLMISAIYYDARESTVNTRPSSVTDNVRGKPIFHGLGCILWDSRIFWMTVLPVQCLVLIPPN